jgi:hypothetical protein
MVKPKSVIPVEIAGFRSRHILVRDDVRETLAYQWQSFPNANYSPDDFEPFDDDWANQPPF